MTSNQRAYVYGFAAVLLWSTVATAFKIALGFFSPLQLVLVAVLTSCLALGAIVFVQAKAKRVARQFKQSPSFYLLSGLLNPFFYYYVLFAAYDLLPAQQALALNYTWAILLPIMAVPILKHTLNMTDIIAAAIGYFGVYVIATNGQISQFSFDNPVGIALALLSTVIWCSYWMINAKDKGDPIISLLLSFMIATPIILTTLLLTDGLPTLSFKGLAAGMYVGLFEMGFTFVLWLMALKSTDKTANISTMAFLTPVISVGFIALILQEQIQAATLIGLALIILGLGIQQLLPRLILNRTKPRNE